MSKRARVRMNAEGTWCAQVYLGTAPDGRRVRPYRSFPDATTEAEAQAMADEWLASLAPDGTPVRSALVSDLMEQYVHDRSLRDVTPNTAKQWRMFARTYVEPYLGGRIAGDLSAHDVASFEARLITPRDQGGRGLSRATVANVHTFLSRAFDRWAELGLCAGNPVRSVPKPRPERHEAASIDEWDFATVDRELSRLIGAVPADERGLRELSCALAAWLALRTGVRCGEACALRRRDVSARLGSLHVCGNVVEVPHEGPRRMDTKGKRSRNVSMTPDELAQVARVLARQDGFWGSAGGADWPLVTVDGSLMRPTSVSKAFSRVRDRCGLPRGCTFHALRHTHATWLLLSGVDVKTVSERLGHADAAVTLRTYAHVMPGRDLAAAEAFERFAAAAGRGG